MYSSAAGELQLQSQVIQLLGTLFAGMGFMLFGKPRVQADGSPWTNINDSGFRLVGENLLKHIARCVWYVIVADATVCMTREISIRSCLYLQPFSCTQKKAGSRLGEFCSPCSVVAWQILSGCSHISEARAPFFDCLYIHGQTAWSRFRFGKTLCKNSGPATMPICSNILKDSLSGCSHPSNSNQVNRFFSSRFQDVPGAAG